jgi:hypothetical protein
MKQGRGADDALGVGARAGALRTRAADLLRSPGKPDARADRFDLAGPSIRVLVVSLSRVRTGTGCRCRSLTPAAWIR